MVKGIASKHHFPNENSTNLQNYEIKEKLWPSVLVRAKQHSPVLQLKH